MRVKRIDLKVGYLCNNHCRHCAIGDNRRDLIEDGLPTELTLEQIKALIDDYSQKYDVVTLTGGEISIRKDCIDIIKYASSKFNAVEIQTNGRNWLNIKDLSQIFELRNLTFTIAIHADDPKIHDRVTCVPHSWEQTTRTIKVLSKTFPVIGKFVITNENKHTIVNTVHLCNQLGCQRMDFAFVHGVGDARLNLKSVTPMYSELKQSINEAIRIGRQYGMIITTESFPFCMIDSDNYQAISEIELVKIDGDCKPVLEQSYNWNTVRISQNKAHSSKCSQCIVQNNCEGCWKEYLTLYDDFVPLYPDKNPLPKMDSHRVIGILRVLDQCR